MNTSNLMDFSVLEDEENRYRAPPLAQTPIINTSILKPSTKDNLIQLTTPVHKNLKVKFQTPQTGKKVTPRRYEKIQELDDQENWVERTTVVLKSDHEENISNAQAILLDLVGQIVERAEQKNATVTSPVKGSDSESLYVENCETNIAGSDKEEQVTRSPPFALKSGHYSLDFDNLDKIDPFKSGGGLSCSPQSTSSVEKTEKPANETINQSDDIFDLKLEDVANITVSDNKISDEGDVGEADVTVIENDLASSVLDGKNSIENSGFDSIIDIRSGAYDFNLDDTEDPFATKKQLPNSPLVKENPFAALKSDIGTLDSVSQTSSSNIVQDNLTNHDEDPFASKNKVANSPLSKKEENQFETQTKVENSPCAEENAFAMMLKVSNSPSTVQKGVSDNIGDEENPFSTKTKICNSPNIQNDEHPFVTKSSGHNSPKNDLQNVDPFATKVKVMNSPEKVMDNIDPFSSRSKVLSSPAQNDSKDPFATKSKVPNSPAQLDGVNPSTIKSIVPNSLTQLDNVDPFATKSKVPNSPTQLDGVDPFATKSKVPNSPTQLDHEDPFTTKIKMPNSLTQLDNVDPFATKSKVPNSPTQLDSVDPFATKSEMANSPTQLNGVDPFSTKSKVPNSPILPDGIDPFATKSKVPISPAQHDPFATKNNVPNTLTHLDGVDPFAAKNKLPCSPTEPENLDPFAPKSEVPNSPKESEEKQTETKQIIGGIDACDPFSPQFPVGNVSTKITNKIIVEKPEQAFEIDEDQFKPASDIFNDTAAWDALENFGSSSTASSALSRQSLYVKFDPLVNLPPDDPRRGSIDFRRASMKLERIKELNAEESFLLLGTPPKTSSVRNVGVVPHGGAKKKTPGKTHLDEVKKSEFDLLSDSPDILSMSFNVNRLGKHAEGIKMNLADIQDSGDGIVEVLKYTEADLKKIEHAILMEVQGKILAREREYTLMKQQFEKEMKEREEEFKKDLAAREAKAKKNATNFEEMMVILTEYEKTIDNLINEKEKLKEDKDEENKILKQNVEQLTNDVQSVESAFSDLHRRYEKMKTALQGYKTNEETLKKYVDECTAKVKGTEEKMLSLKKDAEAKLKKAMSDNETLKSELEAETSKLKVALKRKEMESQGLQNQLEQKIKENTELTNLCDELLAKVK